MSVRRPKSSYKGKNGFVAQDALNKESALSLAHFVLGHAGSYFPSQQALKEIVNHDDDLRTVRNRLHEIQDDHTRVLEAIYDLHAREYHRFAQTQHCLREDSEQECAEPHAQAQLDKMYKAARHPWLPIAEWSSDVSYLRYAHLRTVMPLHARRAALEAEEDIDRRRREALFPATKDEWREASAGLQLRVARFLAAKDPTEKEGLMGKSGWAWSQVKPLCDEYENDSAFKAEVDARAEELAARDPRRKPSDPQVQAPL